MIADKNKVNELLPQDKPMLMVHSLLQHEELFTMSSLQITADNIFVDKKGFFTEPGIVENIAQTAALRSGYQASLENTEPKVGFIGSIKNLNIFKLPKVDQIIMTRVEVISELMGAMVVKGIVYEDDDTIIAEGNLNIFIQE